MNKEEGNIGVFPKQVDNNFQGYKIAATVFFIVTICARVLIRPAKPLTVSHTRLRARIL